MVLYWSHLFFKFEGDGTKKNICFLSHNCFCFDLRVTKPTKKTFGDKQTLAFFLFRAWRFRGWDSILTPISCPTLYVVPLKPLYTLAPRQEDPADARRRVLGQDGGSPPHRHGTQRDRHMGRGGCATPAGPTLVAAGPGPALAVLHVGTGLRAVSCN